MNHAAQESQKFEEPQLFMSLDREQIKAAQSPVIPDGFTLRKIQEGDDPAYIELMQSAGFRDWNARYPVGVRNGALDGGIFFLVENATGRLAATTMANRAAPERPGEGELGWVAVHPDFRGRHFAKIICQAVVDFYRQAGYTKLILRTEDFRLPAIRIYLQCGWQPVINDEKMSVRWERIRQKLG